MKLVITMSRRFGTGASIIATELSKRLDITFSINCFPIA